MTTIEQQPRKYSREGSHPRGFATLTPERRRELASMGGTKAQALKVGHRFTKEEARAAGAKGGSISRRHGPSKNKLSGTGG